MKVLGSHGRDQDKKIMGLLLEAYPASPMRLGSRPTVGPVPTATISTVSSTSSSTVRPTVSVNNYAKMPKGSRIEFLLKTLDFLACEKINIFSE